MKSEIRAIIYKHPLKNDREILNVEKQSFRKIYEELELEFDIKDYIIIDGDTVVTDFTRLPKADNVYFKCVPQGDGGGVLADEGNIAKGIGGGIAALGIILAIVAGPVGWGALALYAGISLAVSGLMTIGVGVLLYNYELETETDSFTDNKSTQTASISGSKNSDNRNGKIPVLFGRHLIMPFFASKPYTGSTSTVYPDLNLDKYGIQYFYGSYCSGYKEMYIHEDTYKLGESPLNSFKHQGPYVRESSSDNVFFTRRVSEDSVGMEIPYWDNSYDNGIVRTTSKNTTQFDIGLIFPKGLIKYMNNGAMATQYCTMVFMYKKANEPDSAYKILPLFSQNWEDFDNPSIKGVNFTAMSSHTVRWRGYYILDNKTPSSHDYCPDRQYTVKIIKRSQTYAEFRDIAGDIWIGYNWVNDVYLEKFTSYTGVFDNAGNVDVAPIIPEVKAELNVISLQVQATEQLKGTIDNFNYEATAYSRYYTGSGTGPSSWGKGLTSNPASAFLKALTDTNMRNRKGSMVND